MTRATAGKARPGAVIGLFIVVVAAVALFNSIPRGPHEDAEAPGPAARQPGIAIGLIVDVSGSMQQSVTGADGKPSPKIEIARRAAAALVKKAEDFQRTHPDRTLRLAIYEFSGDRGDPCRRVVPLGAPDAAAASQALGRMSPGGGTPIGSAMAFARKDLDKAALMSGHLVVVTDGDNTEGPAPGEIMASFNRLSEQDRPSVYFVAFDVAAAAFAPVKNAGGLVLSAGDEKQLFETLDVIVGEKILIERVTPR